MDERVLFVEDDPSIREITSLGLREAGLSVETAADGREALVRFRAEPYDLVVLDVMLTEARRAQGLGMALDVNERTVPSGRLTTTGTRIGLNSSSAVSLSQLRFRLGQRASALLQSRKRS